MRVRKYELILRESQSFKWDSQGPKSFASSELVYGFLTDENILDLSHRPEEHVIALALNIKGELIGMIESAIGDIASANINTKQLLQFAIGLNSPALIIAHNHPSGDPTPSQEDIDATGKLQQALELLEIKLVDRIIVGHGRYTSLRAEGVIPLI